MQKINNEGLAVAKQTQILSYMIQAALGAQNPEAGNIQDYLPFEIPEVNNLQRKMKEWINQFVAERFIQDSTRGKLPAYLVSEFQSNKELWRTLAQLASLASSTDDAIYAEWAKNYRGYYCLSSCPNFSEIIFWGCEPIEGHLWCQFGYISALLAPRSYMLTDGKQKITIQLPPEWIRLPYHQAIPIYNPLVIEKCK